MARWQHIVLSSLGVPVAIACSSVLGIDAAKLEPAGGAGGSGTAGAGGGNAGDSSTGGSSSDTDAGDPLHPKSLCAEYCAVATQNCTGQFELYPSLKFCLAVCATLPVGLRSDVNGNTVGCRLHYAESAAAVEKGPNCTVAGPGGNGTCGTNCEGFCSTDEQICSGIYLNRAACLAACSTFPVKGAYDDSIQSGNSVECRLYHVNAAAGIDPNFHCPHTDIKQMGPCSAPL